MNKVQLTELLDKYFDGTCTPEETEAVDRWYKQYNDKPGYTETLSNEKKELLKAKVFAAINERVFTGETVAVRPMYRKWWLQVAAAAVLLILIKLLLPHNILKPVKTAQLANSNNITINRTKNIVKQTLPDSSVVWLSPNAILRWPKYFNLKSRDVSMTGNCFFEVAKNPNRPFIISSEHIVTKVWGTSFRVIDGKDVNAATVTVVTGKVSVSKKGGPGTIAGPQLMGSDMMLHPKEQATLKNNNQLVVNQHADIADLAIYAHVSLSFDNAKLTDIVAVLNKKFDVNIKIRNEELDKAVMTADLTDLNLPEVLEVLKASMKLDYEISNHLIVLKKPIK
jgi:ferric-dicitrate binding protein FerR (iron transport regulator)